MVRVCFVPDCNHNDLRKTCRFFKFPRSSDKYLRWKFRIGRVDASPTSSSLVCSCHFPRGDKSVSPSIFRRIPEYRGLFSSPRQKKREGVKVYLNSPQASSTPVRRSVARRRLNMGNKESTVQLQEHEGHSSELEDDPLNQSMLSDRSPMRGTPSVSVSEEESDSVIPEEEEADRIETFDNLAHVSSPSFESCGVQAVVDTKNFSQQCDLLSDCVKELQAQMKSLQDKNQSLNTELKREISVVRDFKQQIIELKERRINKFSAELILVSDSKVRFYTGLPNQGTFLWLLSMFDNYTLNYYSGKKVVRLSRSDQLLLTLMKLRLNPRGEHLADMFCVSETTVSNIFKTWLSALHTVLFVGFMSRVPTREENACSAPECFKEFPHTRMIIDCTEVFTEKPESMKLNNLMFSNYKHRITLKGLIGIAPNGTITYVSALYPGSTSDKMIVEKSGMLSTFSPGDLILADKGFLIDSIVPDGVEVNIPPHLMTPQFSVEQVKRTTLIARARIHVERAICRMKDYHIIEFIPSSMVPAATHIFQTCAALCNLKSALIVEVVDSMKAALSDSDED